MREEDRHPKNGRSKHAHNHREECERANRWVTPWWSRRFPIDPIDEEMDEQQKNSDSTQRPSSLLILGNGIQLNLLDNTGNNTPPTAARPRVLPEIATIRSTPRNATKKTHDVGATDCSSSAGDSTPSHSAGEEGSRYTFTSSSRSNGNRRSSSFFQPVTDWWSVNVLPNLQNLPKIQIRVEPTTTLKIRKTFRPLKTIVRLSAHFNTQQGVWQFRSTWEDAIIGGKLTLSGRELQLAKSWQLSVGPVEDLVTRLRLRGAVDLQTWKAYLRVGFRTERLSPINVMEGFKLLKQIPLDGNDGHIKLEVKANFALPEPEIEYSTEAHRSLVGMGDVEVGIEELNLLLDY